nr:unnamed protein product [Callosobruchus chinensis]
MASYCAVLCFGILLSKIVVSERMCFSAVKKSLEFERRFRAHYRQAEVLFKCGVPRLTAVSAKQIVRENGLVECLKDFKVEPSWTMLYRCENSGCCADNMACVTDKDDDDVPIVFRIRPRNHRNKQRHPMFIELMTKNHSSCICDDIITK